MWTITVILLLLTPILATAVPGSEVQPCGELKHEAQDIAKSFTVSATEAQKTCTWTIHTTSGRTIQVSLPVVTPSQPEQQAKQQCIKAFDGTTEKKLCNDQVGNKLTSKNSINITLVLEQVPVKVEDQVTIEYQLVNDKECSQSPEPAKNEKQSFFVTESETGDVPLGLQCIWRVNTTGEKNIIVELLVDSSTTQNQCVTVSNVDPAKPQQICGQATKNKFVSAGKDVSIKYGGSSSGDTVKTFQVFYKLETPEDICGNLKYEAKDIAQQFTVSATEAQKTCTWTVHANSKRTIQVSLPTVKPSEPAEMLKKQCVRASDGVTQKDLCNDQEGNKFTSKKSIDITLILEGGSVKTNEQVTIEYQLVNDEGCSLQPPAATTEVQSFNIAKAEIGDIPPNLQCIWSVDAEEGKTVIVELSTNADAKENQCVNVSDVDKSDDERICAKAGENQYVSNGRSVLIHYEGGSNTVPNFEVYYKSSATSAHIYSLLLFLGLHCFSDF